MSQRRAGQGLGHLAGDAVECAVYVVLVTAELAGMYPQAPRRYDRLGLISPVQTRGRGWRYSHHDVERLCRIQFLSQEDVNLEGICRIPALKARVGELEADSTHMYSREAVVRRIFAAAADGEAQVAAPDRQGREPAPRHPEAGCVHAAGTVGGAGTASVPVHRWY